MELRTDIDFYEQRFLMFVLDQIAHDLERDGKDVIRMTLGKSELPLHPRILSTMEEALLDFRLSSQVFPAGLPELKEKLSAHYRDRYGVEIPSRRFVIGAGTSSIFRNLFHLLLNREDEVLLPSPYYSLYRFSALLTGAKIRYYRIDPNTMKVDMQSFRDNVTPRTRVVVVNSPGNPLGNIVSRDEMLEMDAVVNGQAVIIHDEIYANMRFDTESFSSVQLGKTRSVFITTNAFSKGYRMYARRVGYCIVPENLIEPLTVIQHHTMLTVDPVVQYGAAAALDLPEEVEKLAELYRERRDYTVERFEAVPDVTVIPSYGGFYLVLDCSPYMERRGIVTSLELATRIIQSTLVATVPGSDFGMPECLRLSFSSSKYKEGIDRLAAFFAE
ncbi:pyridoxal phosphate-dependent aminotransferase [Cohnella cholangitidis]|uniref:Aminotransferase class I/II-fold pyridoxal phosphate-dependent enzyme n=1 Tax=Cohnella cholangitidis TaxID=2598458 RepID=A0A7G5C246_9BACL|nr:aminotransferase class I/II-fold pyridoxal phosphate-dependent enzyme [Cohnella cholangitidis]QMV43280.1 aminotransferase class I/II-fold pyridoxal phosphate-dependent enzyme [Cohnella cholangitidis]